tara:strand:- start:305 stop:832 length:528 start_codon:yes stop_codon:yes gene_type:complete
MSRRLEEAIRRLEKKVKSLQRLIGDNSISFQIGQISNTHDFIGDVLVIGTSTHATAPAKGQLVFYNSSKQWAKAAAGDGANAGDKHPIGIALSTTPHSDGVLAIGLYKLDSSHVSGSISAAGNFDVGQQVFIHPHTSGSFTTLVPSGSGETVRVVGHAVDTDVIYFNPSGDFIEV